MKHQSSLVVWALVAAVLGGAACGEVSSNKADASVGMDTAPPGDFTIGVNPGTLSVGITGEGTVAIDLIRGEGLTDTVALSVSGAPTGVTTAFDMASLPLGSNAANLTVTAGNTAEAGTATLTVTATAGAITHTATLDLTLTTSTVTGRIRTTTMGVVVRIVGKSATTTDADGVFTFTDVKVPYDIYVIGTDGIVGLSSTPAVNYYKGLTRTDPVLTRPSQAFNIATLLGSTGTVSGTRSGGNANDSMVILWSTGGDVKNTANGGAYSAVDCDWSGTAATRTGTLYGLQITRTGGAPSGYPGYAAVEATVNKNANTVVNLPLGAVATTANLSGAITQPGGFASPTLTMTQQFGNRSAVLWTTQAQSTTSVIPVLADGKTAFHASSVLGAATSQVVFPGLNASTDLTFAMPAPPVMTGPVNNATNVTATTPFDFTTVPMTAYGVHWNSSNANFHVYTMSGSNTIPNIPELPLPSAQSYTWTVEGFGPAADINKAADMNGLEAVAPADFDGSMHFQLTIGTRSFTTQ